MRMKAKDLKVDDPNKAMAKFQAVLGKLVKVPKTETKAKHKHTTGRPKRTPKR